MVFLEMQISPKGKAEKVRVFKTLRRLAGRQTARIPHGSGHRFSYLSFPIEQGNNSNPE